MSCHNKSCCHEKKNNLSGQKHCGLGHPSLEGVVPSGARKIVLVGNPNVGKSVFFNYLTGLYVDVSNFPGTTVDISYGKLGEDVVIDTPGVYGISSFNDEERVARDVILSADLIVNVVDAVHLERDLFLTLQVIDTGIPVLVALNMVDDAAQKGIQVDAHLLEHLLGVPVVSTVAVKGQGLEQVRGRLDEARAGSVPAPLQRELKEALNRIGSQAEALLVLEGDPHVAERHGIAPGDRREAIYSDRRERVNDLVCHVLSETQQGVDFATRLGRWMLRPATGVPFFLLAVSLMFYFIGVFVAQDVVGFTEETLLRMAGRAQGSRIGAGGGDSRRLGQGRAAACSACAAGGRGRQRAAGADHARRVRRSQCAARRQARATRTLDIPLAQGAGDLGGVARFGRGCRRTGAA